MTTFINKSTRLSSNEYSSEQIKLFGFNWCLILFKTHTTWFYPQHGGLDLIHTTWWSSQPRSISDQSLIHTLVFGKGKKVLYMVLIVWLITSWKQALKSTQLVEKSATFSHCIYMKGDFRCWIKLIKLYINSKVSHWVVSMKKPFSKIKSASNLSMSWWAPQQVSR